MHFIKIIKHRQEEESREEKASGVPRVQPWLPEPRVGDGT